MAEMIALFIHESEEAIERILIAQTLSDYTTIRKIVHKIKPSVDVIGIASIAKEIKQIEETSEDDIDNNLFAELINTILKVLKDAISQIKSEILSK